MCTAAHKYLWVLAFFVITTSACTQPPVPDTSEADINAIRAITDRFDEAINAGDFQAVADLYHENAIRMPADAPAQVGKPAILEWFRNERGQYEIELDNIVREAEVFGDWGFARGDATGTLTARDGSGSRVIDSKWMSVSRRMADGSWKIHRDIYNGNAPSSSPEG